MKSAKGSSRSTSGSSRQGSNRNTEFLTKLQRIHGANSISRDPFGRRQALPSEVARQLRQADQAQKRRP